MREATVTYIKIAEVSLASLISILLEYTIIRPLVIAMSLIPCRK